MNKYTVKVSAIMRGRHSYGDLPVIVKQVVVEANNDEHAKEVVQPHLKAVTGWKWARVDRPPQHLAKVSEFDSVTIDGVSRADEMALVTELVPEVVT